MEHSYHILLRLQFALIIPVLILLIFFKAPYGKFSPKRIKTLEWNSKMGWYLMELPAVITMILLYFTAPEANSGGLSLLFLILWECHYIYRTFIFPFLFKNSRKNFPVLIIAGAWLFNMMNGFINGYYLFHIGPNYSKAWLSDPRFIIGLILFLGGFSIHFHSDHIIRQLRRKNGPGYHIPRGGFFRWISSPNYLGEVIEWLGFAVMTWSLPGLAFALFSFANLFPRALATHRWYKNKFEDYPKKRYAFFPGI